jgi:hypothetical protein
MWFVPSLLLVTLVYAVLRKAFGKKWNSIAAVIVFCLLNIAAVWSAKTYGDTQIYFLLLLPMKCIFFLPFMEFGVLYREKIEPGMANLSRGGNIILLFALMLLNVIRMMCLPDPQDIVLNSLYNFGGFTSPFVITPLISSVIGILFWVTVADIIGNAFKDNRVVNWIPCFLFQPDQLHATLHKRQHRCRTRVRHQRFQGIPFLCLGAVSAF